MKEWQRGTATKTAPKSTNKKQASSRKSRVVTTIIASNENIVTGMCLIKDHSQS